jgi:hypothetical protein
MAGQHRIELKIDLFDRSNQRALALPTITPGELIAAILQEFDDVDYLGKLVDDYVLYKVDDNSALDAGIALGQQVGANTHLVLREKEIALPSGASLPAVPAYLREMRSGTVYKLHWVPAIIGRPDKNQPQNQLVCVNLESHPSGVRVSRRHACITAEKDRFFIESLSNNPTQLRRDAQTIDVTNEKQPLHDGDIIFLERSDISLKFVVRDGQIEQ